MWFASRMLPRKTRRHVGYERRFVPRLEILEDRTLLSVSLDVGANINTSQLPFNQQEETIAVNPTNPSNLFIASNSRNLHQLTPATPAQFAAYSLDAGKSWKYLDPSDGTVGDGDDALPTAEFDTSAAFDSFGNLFWAYQHPNGDGTNSVAVLLSTDGGKSFSLLDLLHSGKSTDHPFLVTGPGLSGNGGSVWVSYVDHSPNQIDVQGAPVTGLGAVGSFSAPEAVPDSGSGIYGAIAVGRAGEILVSFQTPFGKSSSLGNQNGQSQIFTSLDPDGLGSAGFNSSQALTNLNISADALLPAQPHQGVDAEVGLVYDRSSGPHHGRAFMVYSDEAAKGSNDTNIFVRFSDDNGATWSKPGRANDDTGPNSQFLPRIALDQTTGYVAVSWYDCRNDLGMGGAGDTDGIPNDEAQFWATVSIDGGLSFVPNVQVSAGTSSAKAAWTGTNQDYGDYTGLDFYGGKFYPAWADNSNSTGDNPPETVNVPPVVGAFRFLDIYTAGVTVTVTNPVARVVNLVSPSPTVSSSTLTVTNNLGPLVAVSVPDPLAGSPHYTNWQHATTDSEVEPWLAVNPTNPKNVVAIWIAHDFSGNVASVTFDGGTTWQNVAIPGLSQAGTAQSSGADPWLAFAPTGVLYAESFSSGSTDISRSLDGGLTWGSPINVTVNATGEADRASVTADPGNSNYVYAVWNTGFLGATPTVQFTRTTDGGQTWEPNRAIYTPPAGNVVWDAKVEPLPDGTLVCFFTEAILTGTVKKMPQYNYALSEMRSTDKGQSWSAPMKVLAQMPRSDPNPQDQVWWAGVTDPDNGNGIEAVAMGHSTAVDPRNGNLYAVWTDAHFSGGQYDGIAFSRSADGGVTWSDPIQVNQTPTNIPALDRQAWDPTVSVGADGRIGVSYYDLRFNDASKGCLTDYWLVQSPSKSSTDPASWTNETRLTDTSFDIEQAVTWNLGGAYAYFLGDYQGLAAVGNGFAAVWAQPYAGSPDHILFRRIFEASTDGPSIAAGSTGTSASLAVTAGTATGSTTKSSVAGTDRSAGQSIDNLYFTPGGMLWQDVATILAHNHAPTSDDNVFEVFSLNW